MPLTLVVADITRRPLYRMQAEELGSSADRVGANLRKAFERCSEWNAMLLLDGRYLYL